MVSLDGLDATYARIAARWPDVRVDREGFVQWVVAAALPSEAIEARAEDLFLAYACAKGDAAALAMFERRCLSKVGLYAMRFSLSAATLDDLRQTVRVKLLSGPAPAIARYAGRGSLDAFVRVTTVHTALDLLDRKTPERAVADVELATSYAAAAGDPEIDSVKQFFRPGMQGLLEEILAGLGRRDKLLLRLHLIDDLNIDAIGAIVKQHRATVARQLVRLRGDIFREFKKRANLRWGTSPSEVRSIVRMLEGEIQISASRILKSAG